MWRTHQKIGYFERMTLILPKNRLLRNQPSLLKLAKKKTKREKSVKAGQVQEKDHVPPSVVETDQENIAEIGHMSDIDRQFGIGRMKSVYLSAIPIVHLYDIDHVKEKKHALQ